MYKNCLNCKWYYNKKCNCKENKAGKNHLVTDGTTYVEQGYFSQSIEESNVVQEIISLTIKALQEQDFIKKNKSIKKFVQDQLEYELNEAIEISSIGDSITNYFSNGNVEINTEINNPMEFSCCYWE